MLHGKPNFLDTLTANPKRIFLIDAFGALLTTILLFGVLAQLETYFGMPSNVLYALAGIAFCLCIFSLSCYLLIKSNWRFFLRILMACNSLYLLISLGSILKYGDQLTTLGFVYFTLEFIIIGVIIWIEFKAYLT